MPKHSWFKKMLRSGIAYYVPVSWQGALSVGVYFTIVWFGLRPQRGY